MSTTSVTRAESSYSCMDACINSLPLKIVSCIPIVGVATTALVFGYTAYALWTAINSVDSLSQKEKDVKAYEMIELIGTLRDHFLASVVRQVASVALVVLGITTAGALGIGFSVFSGIVYTGGYFALDYFIKAAIENLEKKTNIERIYH